MKLLYIANIRLPTEKAHGVQIMKTCEALARAGATVELIVTSRASDIKQDPFVYYATDPIFSIVRVPVLDLVWMGRVGFLLESLSFAVSVLIYIARHPWSIVYSRDELPLWVISFFVKKVVWESHSGRNSFFTHRLLRAGQTCIVISKGLRDMYISRGAKAEISVAPDAIDLADFEYPQTKEDSRKRLDLPLDKKIVLYIGRLDGWKGTGTLLAAAPLLASDMQVVIIGGEPAHVEKLRVENPQVTFLGYRPYTELADNQAAADVLVLPHTATDEVSARYTSPMKLFSYMASNRPIVASDLPSVREILTEEHAKFFTADNPHSLANALTSLFADPVQGTHMATNARALVQTYTWDARARLIMGFLQH